MACQFAPLSLSVPNGIFREPKPATEIAAEPEKFLWTRSFVLGVSDQRCSRCQGRGVRDNPRWGTAPCDCALRRIFRACYGRFRAIQTSGPRFQPTTHTPNRGASGIIHSRPGEEYCADFFLIAKRTLKPKEWDLFRLHFLLGGDWRMCVRQLRMDRGNFFHMVYRVEQKLGRAYAETRPYGLYPVNDYFGARNMLKVRYLSHCGPKYMGLGGARGMKPLVSDFGDL